MTDPQANVDRAIALGLTGLTFTEHFDTHPDEWAACVYDDVEYSRTIETLRERFGRQIFIGKGIEVCYQPKRMDFILNFLQNHTFDLVLISVHFFPNDRPVHLRKSWDGVDPEQGIRTYLEYVRDAVHHCGEINAQRGRVFDVLGHLDFAKRYAHRFFGTGDVSLHRELLGQVLSACLEAGIVPEINTSPLRQGLGETMPNNDTIMRYAELGGSALSLGSDAHRSQDVGAGFDEAVSMMRNAGIGCTAVFKNRERIDVPLAADGSGA